MDRENEGKKSDPSNKTPRTISRRACDACRLRKVKCEPLEEDASPTPSGQPLQTEQNGSRKRARDADDRPCKACAALPIDCTRNMPVKRRGPPNRLAQQAKLFSQGVSLSPTIPDISESHGRGLPSDFISATSSPLEPKSEHFFPPRHLDYPGYAHTNDTHSVQSGYSQQDPGLYPVSGNRGRSSLIATLNLFEDGEYDTDLICSKELFDTILNDYIDILYPLTPVIHIPTFRADLARNRQRTDPDFFSLTVGLMCYMVSALPRKFHEYRAFDPSFRFKTRREMVQFCDRLISLTRPMDYLEQATHERWAVHALMALSFMHCGVLTRMRVVIAQASAMLESLRVHRASSYRDLNCIEAQLRKKALWLDFYGRAHFRIDDERWPLLSDRLFYENRDAALLFPIEVDDEYITATEVFTQPPGKPSLVTGYNAGSRIFCCLLPIIKDPSIPILSSGPIPPHPEDSITTCTCGNSIHLAPTRNVLVSLLDKLRHVLDDLPPELGPWRTETAVPTNGHGNGPTSQPTSSLSSVRLSQFEAMRANIHATHLWAQSLLTERLIALSPASPSLSSSSASTPSIASIWSLRSEICRSLLRVLYNIRQSNLEPNGGALVYKIRQVASTLLDCPFEERSVIARRAGEYIGEFVGLLARVDGNAGGVEEEGGGAVAGGGGRGGEVGYWREVDDWPRTEEGRFMG